MGIKKGYYSQMIASFIEVYIDRQKERNLKIRIKKYIDRQIDRQLPY